MGCYPLATRNKSNNPIQFFLRCLAKRGWISQKISALLGLFFPDPRMKKADFLGVTFCLRLLAFLGCILSSAGSGRQRLKDNPGNQLTTASALGLCRLLSTFLTLMFYIMPSYFSRSNRNVSTTSGAELKFLLSLKKKKK